MKLSELNALAALVSEQIALDKNWPEAYRDALINVSGELEGVLLGYPLAVPGYTPEGFLRETDATNTFKIVKE
jgi:hypothetical protein